MKDRRHYQAFIMDSARWDGFELREGDIVITTPPKCGTTWMQMCCLLLIHGDPLPASLTALSPWLDQSVASIDDVRARLEAQQHRRVIKTHTPLDGLPWDDRVTYIAVGRDPRDVALSFLDHVQNLDLEAAARARAASGAEPISALPPSPVDFASWVDDDRPVEQFGSTLRFTLHHLTLAWEQRSAPNVALFHYAGLSADLPRELRRLADVLGVEVTNEETATLAAAAGFDSMRARAADLAPNGGGGFWHDDQRFFAAARRGAWCEVVNADALARYDARLVELDPDPALVAWLHDGVTTTA